MFIDKLYVFNIVVKHIYLDVTIGLDDNDGFLTLKSKDAFLLSLLYVVCRLVFPIDKTVIIITSILTSMCVCVILEYETLQLQKLFYQK